jgi:hypothetical protein
MILFQTFAALGAIMILMVFVKILFHAHDLLLFPAAFAFGLFYTAIIEQRTELVEGALAGSIYALAAFGLYMLVKKLSKLYRHPKEGPYH